MGHSSALYITSYLSIVLSKILPHSKTIKNARKLSIFSENDPHRLSNFLQTHTFWKFYHISRTYHKINYKNIWFAKVTIILITMAQVLFSIFFSKKIRTLMPLSRLQWTGTIHRRRAGGGGWQFTGGNWPSTIIKNKNFRGERVSAFPVLSHYVLNYFYVIQ